MTIIPRIVEMLCLLVQNLTKELIKIGLLNMEVSLAAPFDGRAECYLTDLFPLVARDSCSGNCIILRYNLSPTLFLCA